MKLHTSYKDEVKEMLDNIIIPDDFGGYPLKYKLMDPYFRTVGLENDDYFDLPEFKWSDYLNERFVFNVTLKTQQERDIFFETFNIKPTKKNFVYYRVNEHPLKDHEYVFTEPIEPKYPIYVITKGRWENTLTIDTLEEMGVDFFICVEPKELELYLGNPKVDPNKVLVLPENFSERGEGAVPVRNWVWEHSVQNGHPKHWQLDDNIHHFWRWNENVRHHVKDGVFFRAMEDFSDKWENLGLVGCQYASFVPAILPERKQFIRNTRVYSCILINSELLDQRLEERWRGRYNDDTDLSLRVLSTGDLCTVNFHSFLSGKQKSGSMKGGMQDMYKNHTHHGYQVKFDALKEQWGDIVVFSNKKHVDGRPHHVIHYTKLFHQELVLKQGVERTPKINNYNMVLQPKN